MVGTMKLSKRISKERIEWRWWELLLIVECPIITYCPITKILFLINISLIHIRFIGKEVPSSIIIKYDYVWFY